MPMKPVTDMRLFRRVDLLIQVLLYVGALGLGSILSLEQGNAKGFVLIGLFALPFIGLWHLLSFGLIWWGERGLTPHRRRYAWLLLIWLGLTGMLSVLLPRSGFGWDMPYFFFPGGGFALGLYYHTLSWREWRALRRPVTQPA